MKADGLTPIAFTDKDGWPAMGTFDIINMRINGYDFHIRLMAGKEAWDSPKVKAVFNHWRELLPYYSAGALGLHVAGRRAAARQQAGRHVPARLVRRPAVDEAGRPRRPRLLPLPGDQPEVGAGLDRRADRRLPDVQASRRTRRARRSCSSTSAPPPPRTSTSRPTRTTSARTSTPARRTTPRCRRSRRS